MRLSCAFFLLTPVLLAPLATNAANLQIDHVTVAGSNLDALRAHLASIGIQTEFGGPHNNHATQMALTSFADGSYLELIAAQTHPDAAALSKHYWAKPIQTNAGPCAFAVRATDIAGEGTRLRSAGVTVSDPTRSGRDRPDGVHLEWESAPVGSEPNGTFFPFLIHDITPRDSRAMPSARPTNTNFTGIHRVVINVRDLNAAIARYQKAYGLPAPIQQTDATFGARLAWFEGTPIILAQALNKTSWLTERLANIGEGPCAFIIGLPGGSRGGAKGQSKSAATKWFGHNVSWFDDAKLGWRLGMEGI